MRVAMTPRQRYQAELDSARLLPDPAQGALAEEFERLHRQLTAAAPAANGMLAGLRTLVTREPLQPVRGLYLWGGVGRGKTHFMNGFHEGLPIAHKRRQHFHGFMRHLHAELKVLANRRDPLQQVADRLRESVRVLCLDEFHVADITDAMLLGRLLDALFARGVTLVTTSNLAPDELYLGGLQRQAFLPAIDAIKRHTCVFALDRGPDYRLRALERASTYLHPLDDAARAAMEEAFRRLEPEAETSGEPLEVEDRRIPTHRMADGIVWFEFEHICDGPRAVADYMEIARQFHTVFVSGIPVFTDAARDTALRFVHLVDELYDRHVNLVVSAAAPPAALYAGTRLGVQFARTASRLEQMQTREYLGATHLP